ncbi:hypothetical protein DERP_015413, partial [Dermatophagoides pteronyssinus]
MKLRKWNLALEKNPREFRKIMTKIFFVCFKHYHHYDELMVFIVVDMECSLKFDTSKQLLLHQRTHQPNRKHVCHICGYRFKEKFNLNRHQRIHTDNELDSTIMNDNDDKELKSNPANVWEYEAQHYFDFNKMDNHQSNDGGDNYFSLEKKFKRIPKNHFMTKSDLKSLLSNYNHLHLTKIIKCSLKFDTSKHQRTHQPNRKHKNLISIDINVYTPGEKPYKCDKCQYSTARKDDLQTHIGRVHSADIPFK